jgi:hypothetical protein
MGNDRTEWSFIPISDTFTKNKKESHVVGFCLGIELAYPVWMCGFVNC